MASTEHSGLFESIRDAKQNEQAVLVKFGPEVKARLSFEQRGGLNKPDSFGHFRTNATDMFFTYPLKLMLPTHASSSNCQWVYSINYGGGIVSGDNVVVQVDVKDNCCVMLTTQASTKVYHSENELTSQQRLEGSVGPDSVLAVLQDPVTCFAAAKYRQTQTFNVAEDGNLVFMDWLSAGRIASGERWDFTRYSSCNSVKYNDTLIFRDSVTLEDSPLLAVKQLMRHHNVIASCVLIGQKFAEISRTVVDTYGAMKDYGTKMDNDMTIAVSPIGKTVNGEQIPGAVIKFASTSVSQVYARVEEILSPLFPMLGGNPFEDKH